MLSTEFIKEIQAQWELMKSKQDFVNLLNRIKPTIYGEKAYPFKLNTLNFYAYKNNNKYKEFEINKKSGGKRIIHAPLPGLKAIQSCISILLQALHQPHEKATGFITGRSIVDNAKYHVDQNYVYNIDLKDFFPSIEAPRILSRLKYPPFSLETKEQKKIGHLIVMLTTTNIKVEREDERGNWYSVERKVLPQGAPTSPILTNIIAEKLDIKLSRLAIRNSIKYSRYADDITFSSAYHAFNGNNRFLIKLNEIIKDQSFHIKQSKTRLQKRGYKQEVTGLTVNEKPNVNNRYVKKLRAWLYLWERYGYEKASELFLNDYIRDKGHVKTHQPNMSNVISGKLLYMQMVKGKEDSTYVKLKRRFDKLIGTIDPINEVLNVWESSGIDEAMKIYYLDNNGNVKE